MENWNGNSQGLGRHTGYAALPSIILLLNLTWLGHVSLWGPLET